VGGRLLGPRGADARLSGWNHRRGRRYVAGEPDAEVALGHVEFRKAGFVQQLGEFADEPGVDGAGSSGCRHDDVDVVVWGPGMKAIAYSTRPDLCNFELSLC